MKSLRKSALITTIGIYILIYMGGLVRVSGAGLGCPDWPRCFGRLFPPLTVSQLPQDIDPMRFNFVLAWTEYINRLAGVCVGFLVLITVYLAIKHARHVPAILAATIAGAGLVIYQGWQGGQLVKHALEPALVSIHMGLALIIVSLFLYVSQKAYYADNPEVETNSKYPPHIDKWIAGLWIASILQIILGTQVREAREVLISQFPLAGEEFMFRQNEGIINLHWIFGFIMMLGTWLAGMRLLRSSRQPSLLVKHCSWWMIALIFTQLIVGAIIITAGMPELLQLFHLWIASFYIGSLLLIFNAIRTGERSAHAA